jgi:hypothetical protein
VRCTGYHNIGTNDDAHLGNNNDANSKCLQI